MKDFRCFLHTFHTYLLGLLFLTTLSLIPCPLLGQEKQTTPSIKMVSIEEDPSDITAMSAATEVYDQNGNRCALIKIKTTQKGFAFDAGQLGITKIEEQNESHPAEIWVYVPDGVMRLSIQHPVFGSLDNIDLKRRVKGAKTYIMTLTTNEVNTLVFDFDHLQTVDIDVYPPDATLFINGNKHRLDAGGKNSVELPFGKHKYRVTAPRYHLAEGEITLNDTISHFPLNVRLRPTFGFLNVASSPDSRGAQVFVDSIFKGSLPLEKCEVESGRHTVTISRPLYLPYSETILMTDSATITVTPSYVSNYAQYELTARNDRDALIYDGYNFLAAGHWKGRLEAGTHHITTRKTGHATSDTTITVRKDEPRRLNVPSPVPIYGTLNLTTDPPKARVVIDGKEAGQSNLLNHRLLIGQHKVEVIKAGCKPEKFDITIGKDSLTSLRLNLKGFCNATLRSQPIGEVYIDGRYAGRTPLPLNKEAGKYDVAIELKGYSPYHKRLTLDGNTEDIYVRLQRNFIRENEFYFQAGLTAPGFMAINLGMGGYWHNINLEANYLHPLSASDIIYWNNTVNGNYTPVKAAYDPLAFDIKAGYGIKLHPRMRLTPQIGCRIVVLKEDIIDPYSSGGGNLSYNYSTVAGHPTAASLTLGARFNVAFTGWLGLSVTPEYVVGVSKSEGFKVLSETSSQIKNYAEGFSGNVSINIFF